MIKNKIAIYTANVGEYDTLHQPYLPVEFYDVFDFICFTDVKTNDRHGYWKFRQIDYHNDDKVRIARYVKLHPHKFLQDYEYSVWIDSNIEIIGSVIYENCLNKIKNDIKFSSVKHPKLNCAYSDGVLCAKSNKDSIFKIRNHLSFLESEDYPKNNGLFETQIVFRKHNNPQIIDVNNLWWKLMTKYSRRDQLSINYILWKFEIEYDYFLNDFSTRNHSDFVYHSHVMDVNNIVFGKVLKKKIENRINKIIGRFIVDFILRKYKR